MNHPTRKIHWLGAGLSSSYGLDLIAQCELKAHLVLWNRSYHKALQLAEKLGVPAKQVHEFTLSELREKIRADDIVVSYLPASQHLEIAHLCLQSNCHLLTSSYLSEELRNLQKKVEARNLFFLNELGLDPGLDHFLSHLLVEEFLKLVEKNGPPKKVKFYSACGGFPQVPGEFKYKFSWSPLGVLKALKNNGVVLKEGNLVEVAKPYREVKTVNINGEQFESYSNRNSVPFISEYGLSPFSSVLSFERATLRPVGWKDRWTEIFSLVEDQDSSGLQTLSETLAEKYSYQAGELDRVVMRVSLQAEFESGFRKDWIAEIDLCGTPEFSAMTQLVSGTTVAILRLFWNGKLQKELNPGVIGWPGKSHALQNLIRQELFALGFPLCFDGIQKKQSTLAEAQSAL